MSLSVLILAGGVGKRMKSTRVKVLHPIMGKPMIMWVIETAEELSPDSIWIVHGKKGKEMVGMFDDVHYVLQPEPLGTGDAVMKGLEKIEQEKGIVLILSADVPLLSNETAIKMIEYHKRYDFDATVLSFIPPDPYGYGRIIRDGGEIRAIVEEKDASEEEKKIKEVNGGVYIFSLPILKDALSRVSPDNNQGEYYITDVISIIRDMGGRIGVIVTDEPSELYGVNTREDLSRVIEVLRQEKIVRLQEEGVAFLMPDTVYIEPKVKIGYDTIVYPNTVLRGDTIIGSNCVIKPFVHIIDRDVPSGTEIENSG